MYMRHYICVYIYIYIYLVRHGNVLVFLFMVSIGETAAVLQQPETTKKTTTETINKRPLPRRKP